MYDIVGDVLTGSLGVGLGQKVEHGREGGMWMWSSRGSREISIGMSLFFCIFGKVISSLFLGSFIFWLFGVIDKLNDT